MPTAMQVQPYLFFEGRCEEALEFYRRTLGAEVLALMRSKDSPDPTMTIPGAEDKVIHAMFRIGESTLLASDGRCQGAPSEGGQVLMPLMKTFFSPSFGMVADRFGVSWMIYMAP